MAQRSVANTTISLGLLSIPVKAYACAVEDKFSFVWLSPSGNPVGTKLFDKVSGVELTRAEVSNAIEVEPGKYVVFEDDDMDDLAGDKAGIIEIKEVIIQPIDSSMIERQLWLAPDKKADKQYRLLAQCLEEVGGIAIGTWHHRNRDHLVAIGAGSEKLVMFQLYYANELRSIEVKFTKDSGVSDAEFELGKKLIKKMTRKGKFELSEYVNGYADRVVQAASEKYAGMKKDKREKKVDVEEGGLVELLRKSVEETKEKKVKVG
jgi:DNA end-binding protein Ku